MAKIAIALIALVALISAASAVLDTSSLDKAGVEYMVESNRSIIVNITTGSPGDINHGVALAVIAMGNDYRPNYEAQYVTGYELPEVYHSGRVVAVHRTIGTIEYPVDSDLLLYASNPANNVDMVQGYLDAQLQYRANL